MRRGLSEWVKRHPIEAFFATAIFLSFGLLFPAILAPQETTAGQLLSFYLARLGVYSPVLAGMLVTWVCRRDARRVPPVRRLVVFLPAWLIALVIHAADVKLTAPTEVGLPAIFVLSIPVAILPAFVISSAFSGTGGVRTMLTTIARPTGRLAYYLIALLTFPLIHLIGLVITNALSGAAWIPGLGAGSHLAVTLLVTFLSVLLFSGGINEETGWRGFAQTRLQTRYSPLVANLVLWVFLLIWHIPNDLVQYREGGYLLLRFGLYPFITILFGWVYNRTGGSILAAVIFHASMNSMNQLGEILPMTTAGNLLLVGFALIVVGLDRMWRRLPDEHPAVYQAPATPTTLSGKV